MKIPLYQIDAFTSRVFSGNPAAVCPLEQWLPDETMQAIAAENNHSETAFFVKQDQVYELRWFTPAVEVGLCGHATLAAAFVIFNYLDTAARSVSFQTKKSGMLQVDRQGELLAMNFPARPAKPCSTPDQLVQALGVEPKEVRLARDYLVIYEAENVIRSIKPDMSLLMGLDALGIIITAPGDSADFVSRFFAPGVGVPEDPVTGSAHCTLIPYWSDRLGKDELHAFQVSARGGELWCKHKGDRVGILGQAVRYAEGYLYL